MKRLFGRILIVVALMAGLAACGWGQGQANADGNLVTYQIFPNPPQKPLAGYVVCLDPGHPSEVSDGFAKQNGTTETEMNWQVALRLKRILEGELGATVVLTKSSLTEKVTNRRRAEIANQAGAHASLRLHCDSEASKTRRGITVYYPDRPGKAADGHTGPSSQVIAASARLARAVDAGIQNNLRDQLRQGGVKPDFAPAIGKTQGALTGSIHSPVPVALVEMVFLSNPADAAYIKSAAGQEAVAAALAEGIASFLKSPQ